MRRRVAIVAVALLALAAPALAKRPVAVGKVRLAPAKGAKPVIRVRLRHGVITVQIAPR